jgi:hypothetical protein
VDGAGVRFWDLLQRFRDASRLIDTTNEINSTLIQRSNTYKQWHELANGNGLDIGYQDGEGYESLRFMTVKFSAGHFTWGMGYPYID